MHLHCLELAQQHFHNNGKVVVGAFLCPSSDSYVHSKLNDLSISLKKRNHLCDIATQESSWISTNQWGWANAAYIILETEHILRTSFPDRIFELWLIAGADHAYRHVLYQQMSVKVVCIGRPGDTEILKKSMATKKIKTQDIGSYFILLEDNEEDVSSTEVRKLLVNEDWEKIRMLVPSSVVDVMKIQGKDIFKD